MTTLAALDAATQFLRGHPNAAALAHVICNPEGRISISLVADLAPEDVRTGIVFGLAATYSGDLSNKGDALMCDLTWNEREIQLWTPLQPVGVKS